jgi:hypothetical protein
MRQNYLYKCDYCQVVKSIRDDFGERSWNIFCKVCGTTTEHNRLDTKIVGSLNQGCVLVCPTEQEDDGEEKTKID